MPYRTPSRAGLCGQDVMRLVESYKEFQKLRLNPSEKLFPGTYHIYKLFEQNGKVLPDPDLLLGNDGKELIINIVADKLGQLQEQFESLDFEDGLKAILLAECGRKLFRYLSKRKVFNTLENADVTSPFIANELNNHVTELYSSDYALQNILPFRMRLNDDYHLDFCSRSGRELDKSSSKLSISAHPDTFYGFKNFFVNSARSMFGKTKRLRIDVGLQDVGFETDEANLNIQILNWCKQTSNKYFIHKHSMAAFLNKLKQKPSKARFNNIGNGVLAGYVSALLDANIPVELASHGAMIIHGDDRRRLITSILANCVYNHFPKVQSVVPRSPLQVTSSSAKVIKQVRVKPSVLKNRTRKFNILYAPNFLPWHQCYHGLVPSCFETRTCAEKLVDTCEKISKFNLNIRFKMTVRDIAKASDIDHNRGILPSDVDDLYNTDLGIFDASLGSHSDLLQEADLVISEGITAVLFEALEHRTPLLLLNENESRIPSLPAMDYNELLNSKQRSAVYQSSINKTLQSLLMLIHEKHFGLPLTDKELKPYVWIKE